MDALLAILLMIIIAMFAIALNFLNDIHRKLDDVRFELAKLDDIAKSVGAISEIVEIEDQRRSKMRVENEL